MNIPNFHPTKIGDSQVKLDNVFLQANGQPGFQYIIKQGQARNPVTAYWQWNTKTKEYEQQIDGDTHADVKQHILDKHAEYSFHDENSYKGRH